MHFMAGNTPHSPVLREATVDILADFPSHLMPRKAADFLGDVNQKFVTCCWKWSEKIRGNERHFVFANASTWICNS
jgi:hypothetical protein